MEAGLKPICKKSKHYTTSFGVMELMCFKIISKELLEAGETRCVPTHISFSDFLVQ